MNSTDSMPANLAAFEAAYGRAVNGGAQLAVFPENSLFFRLKAKSTLQGPAVDGPEMRRLGAMVDRGGVPLMMTTAWPSGVGAERFSNSTILLRPGAAPSVEYSKIHLFDVDVPGAPPVRESDHFDAGQTPKVVEIDGWRLGLSICYDLRFAELYTHYAGAVDMILVPSAFLVPTGEAHWHVLLRARAIESQCFVAAPAQAGAHVSTVSGETRHTYGHSLVVDPWGRVLLDMGAEGADVQVVECQRSFLDEVRRQIPMAAHRRLC